MANSEMTGLETVYKVVNTSANGSIGQAEETGLKDLEGKNQNMPEHSTESPVEL